MNKKIIVVTGGAGFVGSNLIFKLLEKTNYKIISIDNYSSGSIKKSKKGPLKQIVPGFPKLKNAYTG